MMGAKLKILDTVIERLKERKSPFLGELYGVLLDNTLIIVSFTLRYIEEQTDSKYQVSENNFPSGIDLYGVVNCKQNLQKYGNTLPQDIKTVFQDVVVSDNPVLLSYGYLEKDNNIEAYSYKNGVATIAKYDTITEAEIWSNFVVVHLDIPVNFACCNRAKDKEEFISRFTKKISSGAAIFHVKDSGIFLTSNDADLTNGENVDIMLCNKEPDTTPLTLHMNKIAANSSQVPHIVKVSMLVKTTSNKSGKSNLNRALTIQQVTGNFEAIQGCLQLSSLIIFQKNRGETHLYNAIIDGFCRIMKLTKRSFFLHDSILPEIRHFYPNNLKHFVTLVYPSNISDDDLGDVRKYVHSKFNLPCDKPLFRRVNTFSFHSESSSTCQLSNVHIGLPPSGVDGTVSLVQGNYLYYHYMHDNINDSGWGCAYRSLQTIFSWYKLHGWTDSEVPSLRDIQQVLVDIQDQDKSFVGSKKWIGSTEVGYVLDSALGVTCRFLHVQAGESIDLIAHELANHFKKHGTPVMIGGGVLAHTILGVDINDENDQIKYLVLDPHYTGVDQLAQIQKKGGIGWKASDFWKKDSFYNLCLPYRKIGV